MVKKIKFEIFLFKLVRMMLFLIFELSCCCELLFIKKYFVIGKQENFLIAYILTLMTIALCSVTCSGGGLIKLLPSPKFAQNMRINFESLAKCNERY